MKKIKNIGVIHAFIAAFLFSASAPLSKILLSGISPIMLAGLIYLGSGIALLAIKGFRKLLKIDKSGRKFEKKEILFLAGSLATGGVFAPIILMLSLKSTPAATASLLLNFECVSTTILAFLFFKEEIGRKIWTSVLFITIASILLTVDLKGGWGFSIGAFGIIAACILWGLDNNFTRNISEKDPLIIVGIKGVGAGIISIGISQINHNPIPEIHNILSAMLLGLFCYGLSIVMFVLALRSLGSSRTSIIFGSAPFIGVIMSFLIFKEMPNIYFFISFPLMIYGTYLMLRENHEHTHLHENIEHEHEHSHDDGHHTHRNLKGQELQKHSHVHSHEEIEHSHAHSPDIHHRHQH